MESLIGKKVVKVRVLSQKAADFFDWQTKPVSVLLDDGTILIPARDDEGNDGGSMFILDSKELAKEVNEAHG